MFDIFYTLKGAIANIFLFVFTSIFYVSGIWLKLDSFRVFLYKLSIEYLNWIQKLCYIVQIFYSRLFYHIGQMLQYILTYLVVRKHSNKIHWDVELIPISTRGASSWIWKKKLACIFNQSVKHQTLIQFYLSVLILVLMGFLNTQGSIRPSTLYTSDGERNFHSAEHTNIKETEGKIHNAHCMFYPCPRRQLFRF